MNSRAPSLPLPPALSSCSVAATTALLTRRRRLPSCAFRSQQMMQSISDTGSACSTAAAAPDQLSAWAVAKMRRQLIDRMGRLYHALVAGRRRALVSNTPHFGPPHENSAILARMRAKLHDWVCSWVARRGLAGTKYASAPR